LFSLIVRFPILVTDPDRELHQGVAVISTLIAMMLGLAEPGTSHQSPQSRRLTSICPTLRFETPQSTALLPSHDCGPRGIDVTVEVIEIQASIGFGVQSIFAFQQKWSPCVKL
jgi:hypothetical protein